MQEMVLMKNNNPETHDLLSDIQPDPETLRKRRFFEVNWVTKGEGHHFVRFTLNKLYYMDLYYGP